MTTVQQSVIHRTVSTPNQTNIAVTHVETVVPAVAVTSVIAQTVIHRSMLGGGGGGGGAEPTFTNPAAVPVTVGGITAGTTFPSPQTLQQMFDQLLYPYQAPAFSSFAITGQSSPIEVGYTIPASVTFTWGTTNSANVTPNSLTISDQTLSQTLASGQPNDGSQAVTMPGAVQHTTATSHVFAISGTNTQSSGFSRTLTFSWLWRLLYGTNVNPTITGVDIGALAGSQLASGYSGTYAYAAGGYKYIAFAHAAGGQITSARDIMTSFNVPFADTTDNAAYSNIDSGGFSYALVSYTNAQGVTTNYRVYRTKNVLGGAISIALT